MEMAQYILSIFQKYLPIVWSWGFENAVAIKDGLQFHVNGFKHQGRVQVIYDEGWDLFNIILQDRYGVEIKRVESVYLDCLIEIIDEMVEHTDDYAARIREQYGILQNDQM